MCVRFLVVQPGVVSTCNVTERISFVNSFCCSFQEGRFGVRLVFFLLDHFCGTFAKVCGDGLFGQSLVCHFLENSTTVLLFHFDSIFDFAHQRQKLDTSFGGALRFGGCAFPVHRTWNLKPTKTRLESIRSNLRPLRSS